MTCGTRYGPAMNCDDVARADRAVGAHVGAHVGVDVAAQADDRAVALAGDLEVASVLAGVVHRHQILAAVLDPLHRALDVARRERDEEILRIELAARAVAAADVVLDHLDLLDSGRPICADRMRRLKNGTFAAPEMVSWPFACVPLGHDAARLHGEAVVAAGARAARGGRKAPWRTPHRRRPCATRTPASGWCRASRTAGSCSAARRASRRPAAGRRSRPRWLQRVLADRDAGGQHHRDRLADIAHLVVGDHRLLERLELRQRLQPHRDDRRAARHVGRGDDGVHARHLQRRGGVDRDEAAVRHGAAQDHGIEQARPARRRRRIRRGRAGSADPRGVPSACR